MKPHRIVMAHHLVLGYGLHKRMDVFVSYGWVARKKKKITPRRPRTHAARHDSPR